MLWLVIDSQMLRGTFRWRTREHAAAGGSSAEDPRWVVDGEPL
jgi:hypothetical protein